MDTNSTIEKSGRGPEAVSNPPARKGRLRRFVSRASDRLALFRYSGRLTLGWRAAGLAALAVGVLDYQAYSGIELSERLIFQSILAVQALAFVVLTMGLIPRERESGTLEVLLASVRKYHGLALMKLLPVCLFVAVLGFALTVGYHWIYSFFSVAKMFYVTYLVALTAGMFALVLSTYLRNQYAAGVVAISLLVVLAYMIDPGDAFYQFEKVERIMRRGPNTGLHRFLLLVLLGFLYGHAVNRLKKIELWMR